MSPSDYEMVEQGYDPPRVTHPLERVEEIVERCETYQYSLPRDEQRALIASWRKRGAALQLARRFVETETKYPAPGSRPATAAVVLAAIDAALKEQP